MRLIGEKHGRSKLTDDDVKLMKSLLAERKRLRDELSRLTYEAIADKFDVHPEHVRRIASGRNWAHI